MLHGQLGSHHHLLLQSVSVLQQEGGQDCEEGSEAILQLTAVKDRRNLDLLTGWAGR